MTRVSDFCIDVYEASLVHFDDDTWRSWSPYHHPRDGEIRALSVSGAVPQGYISGEQALQACQEAGKRLCTSEEWLDACKGTDRSRPYPYGEYQEPERGERPVCNDTYDGHPAIDYFGNQTWIFSEIDHPCIAQQPDTYALSGEYTGCQTPEGVFDMVGNVHEWILDYPDGVAPPYRPWTFEADSSPTQLISWSAAITALRVTSSDTGITLPDSAAVPI